METLRCLGCLAMFLTARLRCLKKIMMVCNVYQENCMQVEQCFSWQWNRFRCSWCLAMFLMLTLRCYDRSTGRNITATTLSTCLASTKWEIKLVWKCENVDINQKQFYNNKKWECSSRHQICLDLLLNWYLPNSTKIYLQTVRQQCCQQCRDSEILLWWSIVMRRGTNSRSVDPTLGSDTVVLVWLDICPWLKKSR